MTTPVDMEALQKLLDEGTAAPWRVGYGDGSGAEEGRASVTAAFADITLIKGGEAFGYVYGVRFPADAAMLVALRNAAPALLAELRAAREALAAAPHGFMCRSSRLNRLQQDTPASAANPLVMTFTTGEPPDESQCNCWKRPAPPISTPAPAPETTVTKDQIKHMVDRFLSWRLPEDFRPDAGISFKPAGNPPIGTNLFDATQAEAMVRHMLDGMPAADNPLGVPAHGHDAADHEACSPDNCDFSALTERVFPSAPVGEEKLDGCSHDRAGPCAVVTFAPAAPPKEEAAPTPAAEIDLMAEFATAAIDTSLTPEQIQRESDEDSAAILAEELTEPCSVAQAAFIASLPRAPDLDMEIAPAPLEEQPPAASGWSAGRFCDAMTLVWVEADQRHHTYRCAEDKGHAGDEHRNGTVTWANQPEAPAHAAPEDADRAMANHDACAEAARLMAEQARAEEREAICRWLRTTRMTPSGVIAPSEIADLIEENARGRARVLHPEQPKERK